MRFSKIYTDIYLKKIYKKQSLKQLTEAELLELLRDLTSSPSGDDDRTQLNFVKRLKALIAQRIRYTRAPKDSEF
jgi:hypothetical protein